MGGKEIFHEKVDPECITPENVEELFVFDTPVSVSNSPVFVHHESEFSQGNKLPVLIAHVFCGITPPDDSTPEKETLHESVSSGISSDPLSLVSSSHKSSTSPVCEIVSHVSSTGAIESIISSFCVQEYENESIRTPLWSLKNTDSFQELPRTIFV